MVVGRWNGNGERVFPDFRFEEPYCDQGKSKDPLITISTNQRHDYEVHNTASRQGIDRAFDFSTDVQNGAADLSVCLLNVPLLSICFGFLLPAMRREAPIWFF